MIHSRGKILKVKFGVNPNSSSVGSDVIYLMVGCASIAIATFSLTGIFRLFWRSKADEQE
jgi:hypothetical protein